jgi:hypothetical protein
VYYDWHARTHTMHTKVNGVCGRDDLENTQGFPVEYHGAADLGSQHLSWISINDPAPPAQILRRDITRRLAMPWRKLRLKQRVRTELGWEPYGLRGIAQQTLLVADLKQPSSSQEKKAWLDGLSSS